MNNEALSLSTNKNEINLYDDIIAQYKIIDNVIGPQNLKNTNIWSKILNTSPTFKLNNGAIEIQFNKTTQVH